MTSARDPRRAAADALRLRLELERRAGLEWLPIGKLPPLPPPAAPVRAGTAPRAGASASPARPPVAARAVAAIPAPPPQPPDPAWDALEREAKACTKCAELARSRHHVVFGVGNRHAALLVVGEAPGFDEDQQGYPFVGRAGKLLTQLLAEAGWRREDVYIANVLKCRPPDNRPPSPAEVVNCTPFLRRQIELLRPRVILALGNHSVRNLLQTTEGITKLRGNWGEYAGVRVMPSFHPAYLLRNPGETGKVQEDLRKVKAFLDGSGPPPAH